MLKNPFAKLWNLYVKVSSRVTDLERRIASLSLAVNHLRGQSTVDVPAASSPGVSQLPVINLSLPFQGLSGEGDDETIKTGPIKLPWNADERCWYAGEGGALIAGKELRALGGVTDPAGVSADSLVSDTLSDLRCHLSNVMYPSDYGLVLHGDVQVHLPDADDGKCIGRFGLVYQHFETAPLGDGKTDLVCPVCVLI